MIEFNEATRKELSRRTIDIVEILRSEQSPFSVRELCDRAADQIDVLRTQLEERQKAYALVEKMRNVYGDQVDALREQLQEARDDKHMAHAKTLSELSAVKGDRDEAWNQAAAWAKNAAEISKSMEFYRDLVRKIGEMFGGDAYVSDDGSIQDEVLALKVPELVAKMFDDLGLAKAQRNDAERHLRELRTEHDELGKICDRAHDTSRKALDKLYACQERHERLKQYIYADAGMVMCSCSLIGKAGDPCPMCGKGPCPRLAAKREKILS